MNKKVVRPFWSYDVQKTEKWLSKMAKEGFHFVEVNLKSRRFFFRKGEPQRIIYEIGFDKMQGDVIPNALSNDGWQKVFQRKHWYVLSNEKPPEQIKTSSVRESIIKRNRTLQYIFSGILIYFSVMALLNVTILTSLYFFSEGPVEISREESPLWMITYTFIGLGILLLILSIYSVIKIGITNRQLINENVNWQDYHGMNDDKKRLKRKEEKQQLRSGKLMKKRKFGWMYAPDKLETWLEQMEAQGLNLYRVNKTGTVFYFFKGSSQRMSYCAEYQNTAKESSADIHKGAGWEHVFSSKSTFQKWTIWSKYFAVDEERPEIYSDKETHLKQARKIALTYTLMFLPLVLLYFYILRFNLDWIFGNEGQVETMNVINAILFVLLITMFGSNIVRTWLYFIRLRKQYL